MITHSWLVPYFLELFADRNTLDFAARHLLRTLLNANECVMVRNALR